MSELEELLKQKKELDRQIKELMNSQRQVGIARYEHRRYSSGREEHVISVQEEYTRQCKPSIRYKSIAIGKTKEDAIAKLGQIVPDLEGLLDVLNGGTE